MSLTRIYPCFCTHVIEVHDEHGCTECGCPRFDEYGPEDYAADRADEAIALAKEGEW